MEIKLICGVNIQEHRVKQTNGSFFIKINESNYSNDYNNAIINEDEFKVCLRREKALEDILDGFLLNQRFNYITHKLENYD